MTSRRNVVTTNAFFSFKVYNFLNEFFPQQLLFSSMPVRVLRSFVLLHLRLCCLHSMVRYLNLSFNSSNELWINFGNRVYIGCSGKCLHLIARQSDSFAYSSIFFCMPAMRLFISSSWSLRALVLVRSFICSNVLQKGLSCPKVAKLV